MRRLIAAAAVLTLTACISDSVGIVGTQAIGGTDNSSTSSVAGIYTLRTVDGKPLPFTFLQTTTEKDEVIDDALTLTPTNTWTRLEHIRSTVNGTVTISAGTDAGTYSKTDLGTYTFLAQSQPAFTGTIVNGALTITRRNATGQSVPSVYSK
jgi:hypothetical protein